MDHSLAFTLDFSPLPLILLCLTVIAATAGIAIALRPLWRVVRHLPTAEPDGDVSLPSVSVIVYAPSRLEEIPGYLTALLQQDHPDFEVIVVFSASAEATATLTEELAASPNLYFTFIPPGSHNLSRRKLAFTIGMKAAKGDVAVFTSSNCIIPSSRWLRTMTAPFADPATDLCLGYTHPLLSELRSADRYYRVMDASLTAASWIGAALGGHPFRGDAANMAVRRKAFFGNKGFARTISLHCGEDDLFVREMARPGNTALAINPDSVLTTTWGEMADKALRRHKGQLDFTRYYLPQAPFLRAGAASCCQWAVLGCAVAAALTGLPSLIPAIVALLALAAFWWLEIDLYRKAARRLDVTRLWWSVPLFLLWRPVGNFIFRLRHRSSRYSNFTWNRHGSR